VNHVEFFPYPVNRYALRLSCSIDEGDSTTAPGTLYLRGPVEKGDEGAILELTVEWDPDAVLGVVLPSTEASEPPVAVGVVFRSVASRVRTMVTLDESGDGLFRGSLPIDFSEVFHSGTLEPVLFRVSNSAEAVESGRAGHLGARLAWGDPIRVLFDHFPEAGSSWLRLEWARFSEVAELEEFKDLLFKLDVDAPGELPVLRLNEGIDGLKQVLMEPSRNSHLRRLRDVVGTSISIQSGTELTLHVISRLLASQVSEGGSKPDPAELLEGLRDWERSVVAHWGPKLFAEHGEAAEEVFTEWASDPLRVTRLQGRVSVEMQRLSNASESFTGLLLIKEKLGV